MRSWSAVTALCALLLATMAAACGGGSGESAGDEVKIGAVYPLSGDIASAGVDTLNGVKLAAEIVNGDYSELDLPLAKGRGLPDFGSARIRLVSADTQGLPEKGASEVDRLVTGEGVAAVIGAYQSAVTLTASQRAERLQVPFVNGASSAVGLTTSGLEWFFRTGPTDETFGRTFFDFLDQQKQQGRATDRVAIVHTNDEYGTDGADITKQLAEEAGASVVADVKYDPTTTDLTSQVQSLRASQPDVLFVLSYTNDAILLVKTMRRLGYEPPALLAYGAGFADPAFLDGVGSTAQGVMTRAAWSLELAGESPTTKFVADLFERKYGQPMTENSARGFTALMSLAMAINEAGSTDPEKVRDALKQLRIEGDETIMPWQGIEFDENGQNKLTAGVIQQLIDGEYRVVFPSDVATQEAVWPLSDAG